ncbi:MAG TPA: Uma2 family endonuclease [Phycisphaerae bacterium]|nr:Uma2 family endonuclease [Phycisphaerae bacterium]
MAIAPSPTQTDSVQGTQDRTPPLEFFDREFILRRFGSTVADYDRIANEDTRLELLDGILIMHSPANVGHETQFKFLLKLLDGFVEPRSLSIVLGSRIAMKLGEKKRFEPDLLFIKRESLHRLGEVFLEGPADLVIEILSPATRDYDLGEKRKAYADAGVPEYWMIDGTNSRFLVDRPAGTRATEMTSGRYDAAAIPGFWLDVAWMWQRPLPDVHQCLEKVNAK